MATMMPTAAAFSNDAWMRAVLAHLPGSTPGLENGVGEPFRLIAARHTRLPFRHLQSTETALTPCPLPSVTRVPTPAEAQAFLDGIAMPLVLRSVPVDHPVSSVLLKAAAHSHILKSWVRAALDVSGSFDDWMMENFDHKRRKELKRLKARLAEQGSFSVLELRPGADLEPHIAAFLAVESSGWKGERGTSINSDPVSAKGFKAGLAAMHAEGKVRFWTFALDKKPLASLFALVDGHGAVLGKIGYDEAFARFSPGVLLIVEATRSLFAEVGIKSVDANAIPGHPMIDRLWRDRVPCMDVVIAGATTSPMTFQAVATYHRLRDSARRPLKQIYHQLTGRKPS